MKGIKLSILVENNLFVCVCVVEVRGELISIKILMSNKATAGVSEPVSSWCLSGKHVSPCSITDDKATETKVCVCVFGSAVNTHQYGKHSQETAHHIF